MTKLLAKLMNMCASFTLNRTKTIHFDGVEKGTGTQAPPWVFGHGRSLRMSPLFHFGEHLAVSLVKLRHTGSEPSHVTTGGLEQSVGAENGEKPCKKPWKTCKNL